MISHDIISYYITLYHIISSLDLHIWPHLVSSLTLLISSHLISSSPIFQLFFSFIFDVVIMVIILFSLSPISSLLFSSLLFSSLLPSSLPIAYSSLLFSSPPLLISCLLLPLCGWWINFLHSFTSDTKSWPRLSTRINFHYDRSIQRTYISCGS